MSSTAEFELEGRRFEVKRLSPDDACLGVEVLGKVLGPAAYEVLSTMGGPGEAGEGTEPNYAAILQALLANASQISVLLKLFAPRAKFDRSNNGTLVELKPFVEEVFGGRLDLMLAFLMHAARAEYACFLGGSGALASLAALAGTKSASPTAPKG